MQHCACIESMYNNKLRLFSSGVLCIGVLYRTNRVIFHVLVDKNRCKEKFHPFFSSSFRRDYESGYFHFLQGDFAERGERKGAGTGRGRYN